MSQNLAIRSLKKTDISEILEIQDETNLSFWSREDYEKEAEKKDSICKVAVLESKIIGFAVVRLLLGLDQNFETAEICNIAVKKDLQGKKTGQKLFDEIIRELEKIDVSEIWLEVRESNLQAINFYKRNDFKLKSVRKNYYKNPTENALILKQLNN